MSTLEIVMNDINRMKQLAGKSKEELLDIKNIGQKSIDEIIKLLKEEGLK